MNKERRTSLNRAAEEIEQDIKRYDIVIDFIARTITSLAFGATSVPDYATKEECKKLIRRHFRGTDWQNEQEEKNKQMSF